jgi:hypothetical protein
MRAPLLAAIAAALVVVLTACTYPATAGQAVNPAPQPPAPPTPSPAATASALPGLTPAGTPTATPSPTEVSVWVTRTPTQPPDLAPLGDFCQFAAPSPTPRPDAPLYFRVQDQGWYRTDDQFATSVPVAPYGALSHDLSHLVTFDCTGSATICVASPPTAAPSVFPVPPGFIGGGSTYAARWLNDGQRLVFKASVKTASGSYDRRLYLLDLSAGKLVQIADQMGFYFDVAAAGNCVAYTYFDNAANWYLFQLARLDGPRVGATWPPRGGLGPLAWWPRATDPIALSWDGRRLAFYHDYSPSPPLGLIVVWDLGTGRRRAFDLSAQGGGGASDLVWSPDGSKIYIADHGRWVLDVATGKLARAAEQESPTIGRTLMYQWLPDSESLIVPGQYVSVRLVLRGQLETPLMYPGADAGRLVDDLFWQ